ncbi:MAG: hypothetical protein D6730_00650 [Bacteroidetes bacterium]|nr:MAG: hypothetical protein D6730_00650 [Bacteroidota bacterium]
MNPSGHYVAIFGGAVSGAEAAHQLSSRGIRTVVFEQNALPYGKIEDGLPKWHAKLRDKEIGRINEKLSHPLVDFVPNFRLGRDASFEEVVREWGFSAILLAIGAWRDRPLPVEGIDQYIGKGFYYQNPYIYWFNHYHEPDYQGPQYEVADNAIVVGGGLASIDVAKVLMIETVQRALRARGHEVDMFTLEKSIAKTLEKLGLSLEDLGLKGCTLYYRRRIMDMPLSPMPTDTPEKLKKAQLVREKVLGNAMRKFLFKVKPLHVPIGLIEKDGRLNGLVFQQTEIVDGRAKAIPGTEVAVESPLVISSIGSLPEQLEGIPMDGSVYKVREDLCCRVEGFENVFALGNAVTGRGNINESLQHGRQVTSAMIEHYLLDEEQQYEEAFRKVENATSQKLAQIYQQIKKIPPLTETEFNQLREKVERFQQQLGYDGDYMKWINAHTPPRLEQLLNS